MTEDSGKKGFSGLIVTLGFIVLAALGIWWVLTPPGIDDERSPRVVRLDQLKNQIGPTENQTIELAPWLNAEVFKVGAVFPLNGSFAIARSTACDQVETQEVASNLIFSDKTNFGVTPDLELVSQGKIKAVATRAVEYSVELTGTEIAPGEVELLNDLYSDPDCLAAIANRDVLVLFGIYRGNEAILIKRAASGGLSLDTAVQNLKEKLGMSVNFGDEDTFKRDGVAMYWALTKVHLDEPALGGETVPPEAKVAIASELVAVESDYAQRAIPNTQINAPTTQDWEAVVNAITTEGTTKP